MGWFKKLFSGTHSQTEVLSDEELISRRNLQLDNTEQREKYIYGCLEQMKMASDETDLLNGEYNTVTTYLEDMEEIERLPEAYANKVKDYASKIIVLEKDRKVFKDKKNRLTDAQFTHMERVEEDMPEGYDKLQKAEKYHRIVKSDLGRLDGEKDAYFYRERELVTRHNNLGGVAIICLSAMVVCLIMLTLLYVLLELDIRLGVILTIASVMIALTIIYVQNQNTMRELTRVRLSIARLISMHNTVKIRYVNNENLLDYLRMKFNVENAAELKKRWEMFLQEKTERERLKQNDTDLGFYQEELLLVLKKLHIAYPDVWMHQIPALTDSKEMVEIRHGLILRRQQLRKQLDYNRNLAESAQQEIKDIAVSYPQDSVKILKILSEFEKNQPNKIRD